MIKIQTFFIIGFLSTVLGFLLLLVPFVSLGYVLFSIGLAIIVVNIFRHVEGQKGFLEKYTVHILIIVSILIVLFFYSSISCPDAFRGSSCGGEDGLVCLDKAITIPNGNITFKAKNLGPTFEFTGEIRGKRDCKNPTLISINARTDFPIKLEQGQRVNISLHCDFPSKTDRMIEKLLDVCTNPYYFYGKVLFGVNIEGKESFMEIHITDFIRDE